VRVLAAHNECVGNWQHGCRGNQDHTTFNNRVTTPCNDDDDVAHSCVEEVKIVKFIDQTEHVPAGISICNFDILFIPFYFL
jgi:ferredoxin-thioredoxin reductase catalytic subunit